MADSDSHAESRPPDTQAAFLGELRFARRLTDVRGVLAMALGLLVGLPLLFGGQLESGLGSGTLTAGLVAVLAAGLTLLTVLELLGGSSERGGIYGLVAETVGGLPAFLAGWAMTASAALLAAGLVVAAAAALAEALGPGLASWPIALTLLAGLSLRQLFRLTRLRVSTDLLVGLALLVLSGLVVAYLLVADLGPLLSARDPVAPELWRQAGRLAVGFIVIEALLASRRQIQRGGGLLRRALSAALLLGLALTTLGGLLGGLGPTAGADAVWRQLMRSEDGWRQVGAAALAGVLLLSAHGLLGLTGRNLYDMSRRGSLPPWLRQLRRPFAVPPLLIGASMLLVGFLVLVADRLPLLDMTAAGLLMAMILLNLASIASRQMEPDRRREVVLPFFPLIPLVAVGLTLALLLNLLGQALLISSGWMMAGLAVYALYSRRHEAAAQEGQTLFGSDERVEKGEGIYRILVPLGPSEQRGLLLEVAVALAGELGGDVLPLQVIPVPDPMAMEEARRLAGERNTLFQWSTRMAAEAGVPFYPITRLARTVAEGIVDTAIEEECDLLLIPWAIAGQAAGDRMGQVLEPVLRKVPIDAAVFAYHENQAAQVAANGQKQPLFERINKILVPTAGGPNAPLAVGLALSLAQAAQAEVVAAYVAPQDATEAEIAEGEDRIQATFDTLREKAVAALRRRAEDYDFRQVSVARQVLQSDSVAQGIAEASQAVDLAFIGASEESLIDQVLFGNLPRQIAAACQSPVIMVRRYRGLRQFWLSRIWDSLSQAFPTLARAEQIDLYKRVRRGARPDVDFFVMMGLAAVIATLGLLLNSGAVIIGAMLVAPLFTPILAFSIAITMGDVRLVRLALESSLKGVFLAIGLALVIGIVAPLPLDLLTVPEIASRVQPNLLDLAVALAAGAAGAYAIARKDVAAALPGVAIAAALVPPLAAVGISLAAGRLESAGGAALLVTTNLIAISLSGAITLLLLGFRPAERGERRATLRTGLAASLLLLVLISLPLAAVLLRTAQQSSRRQTISNTLRQALDPYEGVALRNVETGQDAEIETITATVLTSQEAPPIDGAYLVARLEQALGQPVRLRLIQVPVLEFGVSPP